MKLFLIDALGPFCGQLPRGRQNWSKIPFSQLAGPADAHCDSSWQAITADMHTFVQRVRSAGYNAITLDDLAHLTNHPLHDATTNQLIDFYREKFRPLIQLAIDAGLKVFLTSDIITLSESARIQLENQPARIEEFYIDQLESCLADFPELSGIILRIGESDGLDVKDPLKSQLHLKSAKQTNRFLKAILPSFEKHNKQLILRTWTVGAHRIGDLIWHRGTLNKALLGISSPQFILSMKYAESDFFRYLSINQAFTQSPLAKIVEFQARREYEGAGEFPSFIGWDCQRYREQLAHVENLIGLSVWCQTGGWHAFRRRAFLEPAGIWTEINAKTIIDIFRHESSAEESLERQFGQEKSASVIELMRLTNQLILKLYYIEPFARQPLYFRRVRIPPLLHIYWDSLLITVPVRKLMRHFVSNHSETLRDGQLALELAEETPTLANDAGLPAEDIEFMLDTCRLIQLARQFYFSELNDGLNQQIQLAKKAYKKKYPRKQRQRFRINTDFSPSQLKSRHLAMASRYLLRSQRKYRWLDHLFTLHLLSIGYQLLKPSSQEKLPKALRDSAMGVDSLFK
ncbi:hypothetical protein [Persicirhabdus sediminis]|uniref:Glycosyl hydrolase family 67 n=1 Tax=Persicirhabdus sediminis TaxID=454144 RepID=A0A8J7MG27_9BACT|nr:hypothetical protein [Persicirhabdus sediminis]MBK1792846.1 hypothetical protein [Persicirhabdus sediminis]